MNSKFLEGVDYSHLIKLYDSARFAELEQELKSLIRAHPLDFRLLNLSGICCYRLGQFERAIDQYKKAIKLNPNFTDARINLGVVYKILGNYEQAINEYHKVIDSNPEEFRALNNIGNLFLEKGDSKSAKQWFKQALSLKPSASDVLNNLGLVYKAENQLKMAEKYFLKAIKENKKSYEPALNLGITFQTTGQCLEAIKYYDIALGINPELEIALARKLNQHATICDWTTIQEYSHRIPELGTKGSAVTPFSMLYLDDDPQKHHQRAKVYWNSQKKAIKAVNFPRDDKKVKNRPIRLGYFSSEFHAHPVMHLLSGMFDLHDKTNFNISAFSVGPKVEDQLRSKFVDVFNKFHDVSSLSDSEIANLARDEEIDIAVDLSGFTKYGRPGIFDYRAAPVQISYLGYPGTMGMDAIDYLIADKTLVTPVSRPFYSEKIIFMPVAYQVSDDSRPRFNRDRAREKYGFKDNELIFCSFNNLIKISKAEFNIWLSLLKNLDNSKLWLIHSNSEAKKNLQKYLASRDIKSEKIIFSEYCDYHDYLERLTAADLFLDTFNFNAGATANDALWCGLPVLTKIGKSYPARMASSLLRALSLNELIAQSEEEYESLVKSLATDQAKLQSIRQKLVESNEQSKLFDTKLFTEKLESAYEIVLERFHEGHQPEDLILPG